MEKLREYAQGLIEAGEKGKAIMSIVDALESGNPELLKKVIEKIS